MRIVTELPHGNACCCAVNEKASPPEVEFTAAPHGGPECLWFRFRVERTAGDEGRRIRLVFKYFRNSLVGGASPGFLSIVAKGEGDDWRRLGGGRAQVAPDGQTSALWDVDFVSGHMDFALCYPYGQDELSTLVEQSGGYWRRDQIGVSQGGRPLLRLSNSYGGEGDGRTGVYVVARQHSGETPGSWALHGFLDSFAKAGRRDFVVWGVPLANVDGVAGGDYGKDNYPYDLNRAWEFPSMRHETQAMMNDMIRWAGRCSPAISLDFHAPGGLEHEGVYAFAPKNREGLPDPAALRLGKVLEGAVGALGLAAPNFILTMDYKSRWETPCFTKFSLDMGKPLASLSFEFPYSFAGDRQLEREDYQRAGAAMAEAIMASYAK